MNSEKDLYRAPREGRFVSSVGIVPVRELIEKALLLIIRILIGILKRKNNVLQ